VAPPGLAFSPILPYGAASAPAYKTNASTKHPIDRSSTAGIVAPLAKSARLWRPRNCVWAERPYSSRPDAPHDFSPISERCFSDEPQNSAMTDEQPNAAKIDLAREADFTLGGLRISPSACRAGSADAEERVEPRVMEVLIVLARSAGRTVRREQLIDTCWGGRAVSDDAVTRVIARVRALGRTAEPPHFTLETLPKVGFILAEGARAAVVATPSNNEFSLSRGAAAALAAAFALAAVVAWFALRAPSGPVPSSVPRIAVAPFGTLGGEPELIELSRKTQEAVVRRLTGVGVPTSMVSPVGPAPEGADLRVEGEVEVANGAHAVRARLGYPDGTSVWSARFERKAGELDGLDEEVAFAFAQSLDCALPDFAAAPVDLRAPLLPFLLQHCRAISTLDPEGSVAAGRRLVAAAPKLSFTHGRLAQALAHQAIWFNHLPEQSDALAREARAAAAAALAIDPNDVAAHVALGKRLPGAGYAERERHLTRALTMDPHRASTLHQYADFLRDVGRLNASRDVLARLEHFPSTGMYRAMIDAMRGDFVGAEEQLRRLAVVRPQWARGGRWMIAAFWEDPKTAVAKLPALARAASNAAAPCLFDRVSALAQTGPRPLKGLPASCDRVAVDWRVRLLARQGDVDAAFALLNGAWPTSRAHWFLFYPEIKLVRADKRFKPLAEKLGLIAYWRETKRWPDFCAEPDLPYDCRNWSVE
jgi:DNA-binding winged helix-turn-helix (wHTH) protein